MNLLIVKALLDIGLIKLEDDLLLELNLPALHILDVGSGRREITISIAKERSLLPLQSVRSHLRHHGLNNLTTCWKVRSVIRELMYLSRCLLLLLSRLLWL